MAGFTRRKASASAWWLTNRMAKLPCSPTGVTPNDLAVTTKGLVYFTESPTQLVWLIDPAKGKRVVFDGKKDGSLLLPNGVRALPDESGLVVADTLARVAWSFRFAPDGGLIHGERFYHLEIPDDVFSGPLRSGSDGLTFDDQGYHVHGDEDGRADLRSGRPRGGYHPQAGGGRSLESGFWRAGHADVIRNRRNRGVSAAFAAQRRVSLAVGEAAAAAVIEVDEPKVFPRTSDVSLGCPASSRAGMRSP